MFSSFILLFTALICDATAAAAKPSLYSTLTLSNEICFTKVTKTSVASVSTITHKKTLNFHPEVTSTFTPTSTSTPAVYSTTSTIVKSTKVTNTAPGATSTSTFTSVVTQSYNSVSTSTSVTITSFTTSVPASSTLIPASAGFVPIDSESALQPYDPSEYYSPPPVETFTRTRKKRAVATTTAAASTYPKQVVCDLAIEYITITTRVITASTTVTVVATTPTSIIKTTSTSTSTVYKTAPTTTRTVTAFSTTATTSVSTTVTTSVGSTTVTVFGPAETSYEMCGSNNFLAKTDNINVGAIVAYAEENSAFNTYGGMPDALSCCELCAQTVGCSGSFYNLLGGPACTLVDDGGICDATVDSTWTFGTAGDDVTVPAYNVSNSNCGQGFYVSGNRL